MPLLKRHITQFLSMVLLFVGAIAFLLDPIGQSERVDFTSGLLSNAEASIINLPFDKQTNDKNDLSKLLLSEGVDNKEANPATNALVIVNQVHLYSFLPVERASVNTIVGDTRPPLLQEAYRTLFNRLSSFAHYLKVSPLISGIAINAPPVSAFS